MTRLPRRPPARDTAPPPALASPDDCGGGTALAAIGSPRTPFVVIAPVLVGGRICRVVAPVRSLLEVQEWMGEYWLPSELPLCDLRGAPRASRERLRRAGVPPHEWEPPQGEPEIVSASQLLLVAMLMSAETRAAEGPDRAE